VTPEEHRTLREMLGAFSLGHLSGTEEAGIRAHLDGCPDCRRDLADIQPLAHALSLVDPDRVSAVDTPAPDLGERIFAAVAVEREQRHRKTRRRLVLTAAAVVLAVLAVGGVGVAIGEKVAEDPVATTPPAAPIEPVNVTSTVNGPQASAGIVAHTWGVEIKLQAVGLGNGDPYAVVVTTGDGRRHSAGAFVGTGERVMNCNLNSDVLRPDATGFEVIDQTGRAVLTADL